MTSLAVELGVSQEAISQYINGKIKPKTSTIIQMAQILNTTTDYLLDLTDNPNPSNFMLSEKENLIINRYRSFNTEAKIKVEAYIDAIYDFNSLK